MEKAKIILVEDNQKIQKELCEFLSRYDYETKALNNFENIVEDILKERADLVLLDINLPVYDGYYICRAHGKHVILFHERMGGGFPVYYWRQDGI